MDCVDSPVVGPAEIRRAVTEISSWPEYAPTPLVHSPGLAAELGLGAVWIKDESKRFGLGGVKVLGAPFGLKQQLLNLGLAPGAPECRDYIAVAATDGNHGLALAWAAERYNCRARLYVGDAVDQLRMQRIRDSGAELVQVRGGYDDAVIAAEVCAKAAKVILISDTDYHGNLAVTRDIMAGYAMMGVECARQLEAHGGAVDSMFLQCGVGGMAAGCAIGYWQESGHKPTVYSVEPEAAACVEASLDRGALTRLPGRLSTRMIGLSCGCPSLLAFEILREVCAGSIVIDDVTAQHVQEHLSGGLHGDAPLDTWDTGISGIAGLWYAARNTELRAKFGLTAQSRVLVINSEGASPGKFL
ncbi:pyridoxal-phosphate dependent enzyme [Fodinicurvata fenggangensis]|uniref:pyridoxal-phosphate dependent enzyme n=1 Tax=Fodinicurvata fenggangensis TaxID=1121830 RepID=UPI00047B2A30|nr:pyridoxal-phosphate dependent enzyme [Fodinicurvata fenggangensis]